MPGTIQDKLKVLLTNWETFPTAREFVMSTRQELYFNVTSYYHDYGVPRPRRIPSAQDLTDISANQAIRTRIHTHRLPAMITLRNDTCVVTQGQCVKVSIVT